MPPKQKRYINSQQTPGADDLDADLPPYDGGLFGPNGHVNKPDSPTKGPSQFQIWKDTIIQSQDSRFLKSSLDDAFAREQGSPSDAAFRDRICRAVVSSSKAGLYKDYWRRLFEGKLPYDSKKGRGLDAAVKRKAMACMYSEERGSQVKEYVDGGMMLAQQSQVQPSTLLGKRRISPRKKVPSAKLAE